MSARMSAQPNVMSLVLCFQDPHCIQGHFLAKPCGPTCSIPPSSSLHSSVASVCICSVMLSSVRERSPFSPVSFYSVVLYGMAVCSTCYHSLLISSSSEAIGSSFRVLLCSFNKSHLFMALSGPSRYSTFILPSHNHLSNGSWLFLVRKCSLYVKDLA